MDAKFFKNKEAFYKWLENNFDKETELIVGYYKVKSGIESMNWSDSVDQALCFGWIDGIRRSIDEVSYSIRFTPRKKNSIWSAINVKKVERLKKLGKMEPSGLKAYSYLTKDKSNVYSFEQEKIELSSNYQNEFQKHVDAWEFFENQAPSYKKQMVHHVMSAKQEKTRLSRLAKLIHVSKKLNRLK
jgi:uncharacterized protein YdeI (YjbR/CyaY-like superfamily)